MIDYNKYNFTFSTKEKVKTLIRLYNERKKALIRLGIFAAIAVILIIMLSINFDSYLSSLFPGFYVAGNAQRVPKGNALTFVVFFILILTALYYLSGQWKRIDDKYEIVRKDLIKSMSVSFCKCDKKPCACKEDFIKEMKENKIDLIFYEKA
ncbi:MAG TPA: hypothetical protein GXZ32_01575 [Clostridiales bacterium]|nr:hypothetical protein [Clostridiales bacterium]